MYVYCSQQHLNQSNHRFCTQCGESLPLSSERIINNRYQILHILGQGGFGRTYLAMDKQKNGQKCVLKEFAPQLSQPEDLQKARELFQREAGVLRKIYHPQIPELHEFIQVKIGSKDFFFLVQDYVEGVNYHQLSQQLQKQGISFTEVEVITLLENILPVLSYIHSLDIVHRDISPDNLILRQSDNLPVLIDFGGVKQLPAYQGLWQTNLVGNGTLLGKKGYAPEEQLIAGKVFKSSDLYSLAVTALVLINGQDPQSLYDSHHGTWYWGSRIQVSPQLESVLKKMLAYKPSDRYQEADQVIKDLLKFALIRPSNKLSNSLGKNIIKPINSHHIQNSPPMTKLKTLIAAPGRTIYVTTQAVINNIHMPLWLRPFAMTFIITTGIGLTGAGLWSFGNFLVKTLTSVSLPKVEIPQFPSVPSLPFGRSQRSIENVFTRLQQLEISRRFFIKTVDEIFYTSRPELKNRSLRDTAGDRALRKEWNNKADELLWKIEQANLSQSARKKMGSYSQQDLQRWNRLAKAGKLGKYRSLEEVRKETYRKFDSLFPGQERGKLNRGTFLQIWCAIASDLVGNK
ncbi:serine/threonine-protein kinase [Cylindrospermopsis raciborskii]|uniref:serine/threonine-protein kinase n=1 Tax=Cylindrospermopsis raciborskii TaxID=77022 RepID=UPI0022C2D4F3|nr:serine/threonine-protein kinase [Cylindrospermopsis raciborskii]MCZ2207840.1 serine/threonine-protein kinase [Cylindrospermopsis raciborskii PAMP2011]